MRYILKKTKPEFTTDELKRFFVWQRFCGHPKKLEKQLHDWLKTPGDGYFTFDLRGGGDLLDRTIMVQSFACDYGHATGRVFVACGSPTKCALILMNGAVWQLENGSWGRSRRMTYDQCRDFSLQVGALDLPKNQTVTYQPFVKHVGRDGMTPDDWRQTVWATQ